MDDSIEYAKKHRKDFWNKLVAGKSVEEYKQAIYMAGTPGAGKTEAALELERLASNMIRIDADWFREEFPGYNGHNSSEFQRGAAWLVEWSLSRSIDKGYSYILDGTFAFSRAVPKERFINAYIQARENVIEVMKAFGNQVELTIIVKDYQNNISDIIEDVKNVQLVLPQVFTKQDLEAILRGKD